MESALATNPAELSPGQWLDRYELVYPVAQGGMAQVWLAKLHGQHGFEKLVALKAILPALAGEARFRRMFVEEAKISARIQHINVAHILDLGEHEGLLYLAMEWVDGDSLLELERAAQRNAGALPTPVLLRIMADVCAGLHAAHELTDARGKPLNVVHRDVSPQNILISRGGVVTLIDFGVVKARRRGGEDTAAGIIKGKLQYMAPEQALGHVVDRRADIWAVGATLYRLLARRPLFRNTGPLSTFKRLVSPTPPEPLPSSVPSALSSIVLKALAFEPARRYATAAELGAALEELLRARGQATSRDVAECMELYLGDALAERRAVLGRALVACAPGETTQLYPRELLGGAALPAEPSWPPPLSLAPSASQSGDQLSALVSALGESDVLESPANEEPTESLGGVPESPPRPTRHRLGSKAVAASGLLALSGSLVWVLVSSGGGSAPHPRPPAVHPLVTATSKLPAIEATVNTRRAPQLPLSTLTPLPTLTPLSTPSTLSTLPALPVLSGAPSASEPSKAIGPRSPTPKPNVKRAPLTLMSRKPTPRKALGSLRSDTVTETERQVVDDGF